MKTLHLCHWQSQEHLNKHLMLMGASDTLVIYGALNVADRAWISLTLEKSGHPWHLVIDTTNPNNDCHEINSKQWLNLIMQHKNTLAWK